MLKTNVNQSAVTSNFQAIYKNFVREEIGGKQIAKLEVEEQQLRVSPAHSQIKVTDYLEWIGAMKNYSTVAPL